MSECICRAVHCLASIRFSHLQLQFSSETFGLTSNLLQGFICLFHIYLSSLCSALTVEFISLPLLQLNCSAIPLRSIPDSVTLSTSFSLWFGLCFCLARSPSLAHFPLLVSVPCFPSTSLLSSFPPCRVCHFASVCRCSLNFWLQFFSPSKSQPPTEQLWAIAILFSPFCKHCHYFVVV